MRFYRRISSQLFCLILLFILCQLSIGFICIPPYTNHRTLNDNTYNYQAALNEQNDVDGCCYSSVTSCQEIPKDLQIQVHAVANELWSLCSTMIPTVVDISKTNNSMIEGECALDPTTTFFSNRSDYFRQLALEGYPAAQHSYALLLYSGFDNVTQNIQQSAKFHASAAIQNHLDGLAVLGGCLRTGTGVSTNVELGLQLIEYCASVNNPTGVNKKAALLESNGNEYEAYKLYQECYNSKRVNALLLFNLGWCYIYGSGVTKDRIKGISLWESCCEMAPDEGSEEAAWNLYQEMKHDNPMKAGGYLALAVELGYDDALAEI